jgi:hypothetical protein
MTRSGLEMLYTDDELRRGIPRIRNVLVKRRDSMAKYGQEVRSDFQYQYEKYVFFPAGKPLETDTQIRAWRKKLTSFKGNRLGGWSGEWVVDDRKPPFWTREKQDEWCDRQLVKGGSGSIDSTV